MRILFAATPEPTTFQPMVPLAWALRTAGHEVRFASQPAFADTITQAGLTAVPVGRDVDMYRRLHALMASIETQPELHEAYSGMSEEEQRELLQLRAGLPEPYDVVEFPENAAWDRMLPAYATAVEDEYKSENFPIIAGLVDFARHWQPDLVLWEPSTYAGPIAAKACGAAHARLMGRLDLFGVTRECFLRLMSEQAPEDRTDPLANWLAGYGRKYGFEFSEDMVTGHFTIDQFPSSLQVEADSLDYVRMQYIPYGGPAVVPQWLWTPPVRPRVALTLGTTGAAQFADYTVNVQDVLDSLADLDIEIVATIAENVQKELSHVPDNTRLVSYVPLHALAPTCSVVINHAGAGTFLTTARYGVPQLALPWDLDEPELARRATKQGVALTIQGDHATGRDVRDQVLRLLNEPTFRHAAARLRDEMFALPTPNQLVGQLEELTTKHRTR